MHGRRLLLGCGAKLLESTVFTTYAVLLTAYAVSRGIPKSVMTTATLVALHTTAHNAGATIKLANLTKRVGDLLQVTKLLTVFEVHNSEFEALEAFRKAA